MTTAQAIAAYQSLLAKYRSKEIGFEEYSTRLLLLGARIEREARDPR